MKYLVVLAGILVSAIASCQVVVYAQRQSPGTLQYHFGNFGWASANEAPAYFSIPLTQGVSLNEGSLGTPPGFEAYSTNLTENSRPAVAVAFGATEFANQSQMPALGQTLSGFILATNETCVLQTGGILFGIGNFNNNEIALHGEVLGPIPVLGSTQVQANIELQGYVGGTSRYRLGFLEFTSRRSGTKYTSLFGVDGRSWALSAGPPTEGTYTVYVEIPGYLRKKVLARVERGYCHFSCTVTVGDADGDNEVSSGDFGILASSFLLEPSDPAFDVRADLDGDGEVGPGDLGLLFNNFSLIGD